MNNSRTPRWVRGLKLLFWLYGLVTNMSHPTMGAWIEIKKTIIDGITFESHPTMGAWIEIFSTWLLIAFFVSSHPTMGAWIEISRPKAISAVMTSRTPRWVRGLKFVFIYFIPHLLKSHPTMGAWIEIISFLMSAIRCSVAPHDGCVD